MGTLGSGSSFAPLAASRITRSTTSRSRPSPASYSKVSTRAHAAQAGGVLVALPEELSAETDEEAAQFEVARERGHYVGVMPIPALVATVPDRGHHPEAVVSTVAGICVHPVKTAPCPNFLHRRRSA